MADETTRERFTLKRWSQRKHAAAREVPPAAVPAAAAPSAEAVAVPASGAPSASEPAAPRTELPAVDSLTFDADFTAFMRPDVDPALKRAALKRLVRDPRFNVMDGLDVYIDDYTKFEPLDAETARSLVSARYIFDPPATRLNERGEVEDVPPEAEADADAEAQALEAEVPALAAPAGNEAPPTAIESTPSLEPLPAMPKDETTR